MLAFSFYRGPTSKGERTMSITSWLRKLRFVGHPGPSARTRRQQRRPSARFRPRLEKLEDRTVPSQIGLTVSSLADSGPGTLREAVLTADAGRATDKFAIDFAV